MNCLYLLISLSFLFFCNHSGAQVPPADSQSLAYKNIIAYYKNEMGANSNIYTGKEYSAYKSGIQGTPFFISGTMQHGDVFYDGSLYKNVPLLYDLVRQEVIVNRHDDNTRIRLLAEKVRYFSIAGHRFENTGLRQAATEEAPEGFVDVLYDGTVTGVLVNRIKKVEMTLDPQVPPRFTERDRYFISNGNLTYAVSTTGSVLKAMPGKKEQVRSFIKKNKFKFKKNIEEEMVRTVAYYETLIN